MVKLPKWFVVLSFLVCWPTLVFAEPMLAAEADGVRIVVYKEDCKLKNVVDNLPYRATWAEKGKVYEGCAGASSVGVVLLYFKEDRSVAAVPSDLFAPVTGT